MSDIAQQPLPTILVVDDHDIVRSGILRIIQEQFPGYQTMEASSYAEAMEFVENRRLALVITDLSLVSTHGINLIQQIVRLDRSLPILVFSTHSEGECGLRAIKSGAWGYVQKSDGMSQLIDAIQQVLAGKCFMSPDLAKALSSSPRKQADIPPHENLSVRELQIAGELVNGASNKEVAGKLLLSVKTVSVYRAKVFEKLGIKSIVELVHYAKEHNLR